MVHRPSTHHAQKIIDPLILMGIAQGAAVVDEEVAIRGDESIGILIRLCISNHTIQAYRRSSKAGTD